MSSLKHDQKHSPLWLVLPFILFLFHIFIKTSLQFLVPIQFLLLCVLSHCSDHLDYWKQKGRLYSRAAASPESCIDWGCGKLIPPNWHHAVPTAPVNFCLFIFLVYIRGIKRHKSFCCIQILLEMEPGFFICHCGCRVFTPEICHVDRGFE